MDKQALLNKISASTRLPVLPSTVAELIRLNDDPDLYPAKVQVVLSNDPVLAARMLQVSNSALFARQRVVTDLGEALAILGVRLTMSIATGIAIIDSLRNGENVNDSFDYDIFWRKSVLGAVAANELHSELKTTSRGELFVASLLQDIGELVLLNIAGDKYARLTQAARSHFDLVELEQRVFGIDHAEVGAVLARRWGLPESIQAAIGQSHALFSEQSTYGLSDLQYGVAFAGVLSELWIAEHTQQSVLDNAIKAYLAKVGESAYQNTVASIIEAIPGANELFNMQLLSTEQMANVA